MLTLRQKLYNLTLQVDDANERLMCNAADEEINKEVLMSLLTMFDTLLEALIQQEPY